MTENVDTRRGAATCDASGADDAPTRVSAPADAAPTTVAPSPAGPAPAGPSATLPSPVPPPSVPEEPLPDAAELHAAVERLGKRVNRLRTAVIVLACAAVLLAGAVGALAWTMWGADGASGPSTQVGVVDDAATDPDASSGKGSTTDTDAEADAEKGDDIDPDNLRAADLLAIVGENWANAQRILASYGVDQADLVLITDDGSMVLNPSNWTVTLVADLDDPGAVAVYLRHDSHSIF